MPLFEYECEACGHRLELIQKFSDPAPDPCPKCSKGPLQRRMSSPAIQFKGSGWYVTDYAQKGKSEGKGGAAPPTGSSTGDSSGGSDAGATGSKDTKESKPAEAKAAPPAATPAKD